MMKEKLFRSPTKGKMTLSVMAEEISAFVGEDPESDYTLIVGTDSNSEQKADFVTAIVIHRVGRGARYFWTKTNGGKVFHTLRDRIIEEAVISLEAAQAVLGELGSLVKSGRHPSCAFQIHLDVGKKGPTKDMIKEVVGMVRGNGFEAKIKPDSCGASSVADKHV